jgi:hypothetical protein
LSRRTAVFRAPFGQGRKAHGTPFLIIDDTVPGAICTDDLRRPD